MPLRLNMKPNELLIINGAAIRNGDRSTTFIIENQCKFLRESEIVHESEADTDCKKFCVTLQAIYLVNDPTQMIELFYAQARELIVIDRRYTPYLLKIQQEVDNGRFYKAIKLGKELIAYERSLLASNMLQTKVA